jgi:hypothetical protein
VRPARSTRPDGDLATEKALPVIMGASESASGAATLREMESSTRERFFGIGTAVGVATTIATGSPKAGLLVGLAAASPPEWAERR